MMPIANQFAVRSFAWESPPEVNSDPDTRTSLQPLGNTAVMVEYEEHSAGSVHVTGAWINAEFVERDEFSNRRLDAWETAIEKQIERDAADSWQLARDVEDAL